MNFCAKILLLVSIVCSFFMTTTTGQEITIDSAKSRLVRQLYRGDLGRKALFVNPRLKARGTNIASWRSPNQVKVESDSWFFFVDEQPGANWEHQAKYVLVDKRQGTVRSFPVKTPPREMLELRPLNQTAKSNMRFLKSNLRLFRKPLVIKPIRIQRQKRYAVLVSGGWNAAYNYSRYWNDLKFIYTALKDKYKYTDQEIIVLYANGTHSPNEDLDGDGSGDIDYAATKSNLTTVMNYVAKHIPKNGKFFFFSTNHGGQESGYDAILYLWEEWIRDDELAALSKKIKCEEAIYVMEQCFSGGMMDDLLKAQSYPCLNPKVCVMTAAKYDEVSWACDTEGAYDEYVYHWTAAIYGKTLSGATINADANGDGKVTMSEAHQYAKKHDSQSEHPVIGSCVGGGCNSTLYPKLYFELFRKKVKPSSALHDK